MTTRVVMFLATFLGFMLAVLSLPTSLTWVGVGMVVSSLGIIGWGLIDWIEER